MGNTCIIIWMLLHWLCLLVQSWYKNLWTKCLIYGSVCQFLWQDTRLILNLAATLGGLPNNRLSYSGMNTFWCELKACPRPPTGVKGVVYSAANSIPLIGGWADSMLESTCSPNEYGTALAFGAFQWSPHFHVTAMESFWYFFSFLAGSPRGIMMDSLKPKNGPSDRKKDAGRTVLPPWDSVWNLLPNCNASCWQAMKKMALYLQRDWLKASFGPRMYWQPNDSSRPIGAMSGLRSIMLTSILFILMRSPPTKWRKKEIPILAIWMIIVLPVLSTSGLSALNFICRKQGVNLNAWHYLLRLFFDDSSIFIHAKDSRLINQYKIIQDKRCNNNIIIVFHAYSND